MRGLKNFMGSLALLLAILAVPAHAAYQLAVTIANGTALSSAADLTAYTHLGTPRPVGILMPSAWTTANITVQASEDNSTFHDVWSAGNEYTLTNTAASQYVIIPPADLAGANYIKLRSGTSGSPVNQGAQRIIQLLISP